ncbi:hypothetical protein ADQ57_003254 [Salmonella enterica subsp. enterica]|nr:hypothetical protein [Salmonella enterica subsp. enterica]
MPIQQLPMMKGMGKDFKNADYIDYLPINMLATPKEVLNSSGYLRSFPGIAKRNDVNGVSRGVEYNTAQNAVYRVLGSKLYKGEAVVGDVAGSGRVSMAHGRTSQAASGINTVAEAKMYFQGMPQFDFSSPEAAQRSAREIQEYTDNYNKQYNVNVGNGGQKSSRQQPATQQSVGGSYTSKSGIQFTVE